MLLVGDLIIELTRWCNLECTHCLRGQRQRIKNKYEYISSIVSHFRQIDTITFTGGEPTLAPEIIGLFIDACRNHNINVGNYYIATNAYRISKEFLNVWERLHHWCDSNEISAIQISNDQFHEWASCGEKHRDAHKLLDFAELNGLECSFKYSMKYFQPSYHDCISEGRAENWSDKKNELKKFDYEIWDDDVLHFEGTELYLNCKGNLIRGCDWSFESQEKKENIISHVFDFKPELIIKFGEERKNG